MLKIRKQLVVKSIHFVTFISVELLIGAIGGKSEIPSFPIKIRQQLNDIEVQWRKDPPDYFIRVA